MNKVVLMKVEYSGQTSHCGGLNPLSYIYIYIYIIRLTELGPAGLLQKRGHEPSSRIDVPKGRACLWIYLGDGVGLCVCVCVCVKRYKC